jgi:drug/metabolite transporter (DMT)-like permease
LPTGLLIRKSWIVFVYAAAISVESIIIEFLTTYIQISPILLSSTSITLAGILLLFSAAFIFRKKIRIIAHFAESYRFLIPASLSLAIGIFTWYDSINRIGASKESLIAGPLEIVVIVLLARLFLRERLHKTHIVGISLALIGFILALLSDADFSSNGSVRFVRTTAMSALGPIGFGDAEAMISALGFAIGVLFLSKLLSRYSSIEVAGASMFLSGIFLCVILLFGILIYDSTSVVLISSPTDSSQIHLPLTYTIVILFLFSLIPFVGSLSYSTGLSRIGASLTATIGSSSILITVSLQLMIRQLGIVTHLPVNIVLAILGGVVGFCGIYIIHMPKYSVPIANRN